MRLPSGVQGAGRERRGDIRLLAMAFAGHNGGREFTEDALVCLERHRWPGNVRELQNVTRQLGVMAAGERITTDDVLAVLPEGARASTAREILALDRLHDGAAGRIPPRARKTHHP